MRTARLLFRLYRFEAISVFVAAALLTAAALDMSSRLDAAYSAEMDCLAQQYEPDGPSAACDGPLAFYIIDAEAGMLMAAMAVLPFAAGLLIGVPLVGREIEHRTAALAWSLKSSRGRWLAKRAVLAVVGLGLVLAVPAYAADILEISRRPWLDPATTVFNDYGMRGPLMVFRGVAALGIGLVMGSVIGRVLPAVIVTFVAVIGLVFVLTFAQRESLPEPVLVSSEQAQGFGPGSTTDGGMIVYQEGPMYRDRSGDFHTYDEVIAISPYPAIVDGEDYESEERFYLWLEAEFDEYYEFIPGAKLRIVAEREAIGLSAFAVVLVGLTGVVVSRRRPY